MPFYLPGLTSPLLCLTGLIHPLTPGSDILICETYLNFFLTDYSLLFHPITYIIVL